MMMGLVKSLKTKYSVQIRYVQCDTTGENEDVEWTCKQEGMGIELSILLWVLLNRMAMLNGNFPHSSMGSCHAKWREIFFLLEMLECGTL